MNKTFYFVVLISFLLIHRSFENNKHNNKPEFRLYENISNFRLFLVI